MLSCAFVTARGMLGLRLSELVCGSMQWVFVSAYVIDLRSLFDALPDLRDAFRVVIAHGWRTDGNEWHKTGCTRAAALLVYNSKVCSCVPLLGAEAVSATIPMFCAGAGRWKAKSMVLSGIR